MHCGRRRESPPVHGHGEIFAARNRRLGRRFDTAEAGFEGYHVDYRLNTRTYYLPNGETLVLTNPYGHGTIGAQFNQPEIAAAVKWAQAGPPDYNYIAFNERLTANGSAGYIVSLLGRRVLYFGRTAETHVEHFPR